jgi:membrane protein
VRARGPAETLGRVLPAAVGRFLRHRSTQQAAGIAYRILFSLTPLAILVVSALGLLVRDEGRRQELVDDIVAKLPVLQGDTQQVEDTIVALASPASLTGVLALLAFAWTASGMMAAIRAGLENAFEAGRSPLPRGKLVDLALVLGAAVLVLALAGLSVVAEPLRRAVNPLGSVVDGALGVVVRAALSFAVVLLLYRFVPLRRLRTRDAVAGALVTTVLLLVVSALSDWLFAQSLAQNVIYGSLAATFVFLYSLYVYACVLLYGAEVAAAWSQPAGSPPSLPPWLLRWRSRIVRIG